MLKRFLIGGDDESLLSAERMMVLVVSVLIFVLLAIQYANLQANNRDNQRKSDLYSLQLAIQKHFAINGQYPMGLDQLSNVPVDACQDPSGSGNCSAPDYGYMAFSSSNRPAEATRTNCDGKKILCRSYALSSYRMEATKNPFLLPGN